MKNYIFLLLISILFFSCEKEIIEQEVILPQISIEEKTIAEDDWCKRVKITLDVPSDVDTEINITSEDITANNEDYQSVDETIVIPAGEIEVFVVLNIKVDYYVDPNETFLLIGTVLNGNISNVNFEGIIRIDEPSQGLPILVVGDAMVDEGNNLSTIIPVAITEPLNYDLDLVLTTESVTAGFDDYSELSIQVTIPAGETILNIEIDIYEDTLVEETEIFNVIVNSPLNFTASSVHGCITNQPFNDFGIITILDDD